MGELPSECEAEGVHKKFHLSLQQSCGLNRIEKGATVEILSCTQGQNAGFGPGGLCVLRKLAKLSQKIRNRSIESPALACIIGMLKHPCPTDVEELAAPCGTAEKR